MAAEARFTEENMEYLTENWAKKRPSTAEQQAMAEAIGRPFTSCRRVVTSIRHKLGIVVNANMGQTYGPRTPWTEEDLAYILENWAKKRPSPAEQQMMADKVGHSLNSCRTTVTNLRRKYDLELAIDAPEAYQKHGPTKEKPYLGLHDDPEDCWWIA